MVSKHKIAFTTSKFEFEKRVSKHCVLSVNRTSPGENHSEIRKMLLNRFTSANKSTVVLTSTRFVQRGGITAGVKSNLNNLNTHTSLKVTNSSSTIGTYQNN